MNIIRIVLIPDIQYETLKGEAEQILNSRQIIDLNNYTITNTSFVPKGYTAVVWANPWLEFLFFTHEVQVDGEIVGKYQYYFGSAEIYILDSYPKIDLQKHIYIFIPTLSFLVNVIALLYVIIRNRNILKNF